MTAWAISGEMIHAGLGAPHHRDHDLRLEYYPAEGEALKDALASADAVLFVTPEYNRSIPGALKNAVDWTSRSWGSNSFAHKPSAVIGTSPGALGTAIAQQSLRSVLSFCNSPQMNAPEAYVRFKPNVFTDDGEVVDDHTEHFLRNCMEEFRDHNPEARGFGFVTLDKRRNKGVRVGQPRMNEERFYLYPMKRVAAVLDDEERYTATCHDLEQAGINLSEVNVLKGPEGQRLLDSRGTSHGLLDRFVRWLQHGGYESETLTAHYAALSQDKWLIFIPVRGKNEARRTVDILRSHRGSEIFHFRRWAVQFFPPRYRLKP